MPAKKNTTNFKNIEKKRFALGAKVMVRLPGVLGVVTQLDDEPRSLGEYWHTVKTERGERREPGSNLELVPAPCTNSETGVPRTPSTNIHIGHMQNSAFVHDSPGTSVSQIYNIDSQEFKTFVHNLRELISAENLSDAQRSQVDAEFSTLDAELKSTSPTNSVVRVSLQSLRTILENAAGSVIGSAAYAAIVPYILHIKP